MLPRKRKNGSFETTTKPRAISFYAVRTYEFNLWFWCGWEILFTYFLAIRPKWIYRYTSTADYSIVVKKIWSIASLKDGQSIQSYCSCNVYIFSILLPIKWNLVNVCHEIFFVNSSIGTIAWFFNTDSVLVYRNFSGHSLPSRNSSSLNISS